MSDELTATRARSEPGLRSCDEPLAAAYDVALLDLDGVLYLGEHAVPGAADAVDEARAAGARVAFVTNNASRPTAAIAGQLNDLGVTASADDIVTSAQASARLVAERVPAGSPVLIVGGEGLRLAIEQHGLRPVVSADERPAAVVQGYAVSVDYQQLAEAALAIRTGALYVATNLDMTLPSPRGPLPGNGALVEAVRLATGVDPVAVGKPEPTLLEEARRRTGARRPLMVGDRLETDIAGGVRAGMDTLLVLTGVSTEAELVSSPPDQRPTYVAGDLGGLVAAHPEVCTGSSDWSCGGWTATVDGGEVRLDGEGTRDDGLRAVCAAVWASEASPDFEAALAALPPARPASDQANR
ncbi:MAG: HAD-IIA family hydrolase [Streptosporangiales bacterium]